MSDTSKIEGKPQKKRETTRIPPSAEADQEAMKGRTTRIVLVDSEIEAAEAGRTDGISLGADDIPRGIAVPGAQRVRTVRAVRPPTTQATAQKPDTQKIGDTPKKETTKLPSSGKAAAAATPTGQVPKTIAIKRSSIGIVDVKPAEGTPATVKTVRLAKQPMRPGVGPDAKRKTSRIVLEQAGDEQTPKTITLKKPTTMVAVSPSDKADSSMAGRDQTARIELVTPDADSSLPVTQQRTVKLKRPDEKAAPAQAPAMPEIEPEETGLALHPAFAAMAVIGVLAVGLIAYLLAVQAVPGQLPPLPPNWF